MANKKPNPKQNFNIVIRWLQYSKNVKRRKYYTASQLMQLFRSDIKIDISLVNSITIRSFTRHINSASTIMPTFIRVKHGYPPKNKYIILSVDELQLYNENVLHIHNSKTILPQNLDKKLRSHDTHNTIFYYRRRDN